jgi:hypothetical protein
MACLEGHNRTFMAGIPTQCAVLPLVFAHGTGLIYIYIYIYIRISNVVELIFLFCAILSEIKLSGR